MGSRKTEPGVEQTYDAANQWVARVLRDDDSLFTPGKAVWTPEVLEEVRAGFMDNPDPGRGTTLQKLEHQLTGSTPEAYQLAAEALYFVYLTPHVPSIKRETKLERVSRVLGWSGQEIAIPDDLITGLAPGIATIGTAFASGLPAYLGFIIEFVERWKQTQDDIEGRLQDPWAFKKFATDVSSSFRSALLRLPNYAGKTIVQRHALLHLVHPDTFEPIVSEGQKNTIAERLGSYAAESDDVDRNIQQIRQALEGELGSDFQFHDEGIRERWDYSGNQPPPPPPPVRPQAVGLQALADRTYLPVSFLEEIQSLLAEKGQVIFQGPPGTGKTYVARKLARHLAGSGDDTAGRVRLVQFHPSYAYEDFVQGFRPKQLAGGQVGFELRKGPLLEIAEKARDSDKPHYLIIDEINRGNLATVFGELYFLLEYRNTGIRLQYSDSDGDFTLPENLFIIGTMNTADRSIAMVDLALRRRFYFVEFHPEKEPVNEVLQQWLEKNADNVDDVGWLPGVVKEANRRLNDSDAAIGPSYFMRKGLNEAGVKRIWEHSVLPYIAERLFNDRDRLAEFELENLRKAVSGGAGNGNVTGTDEGDRNAIGEGEG